MITYDKVIQRLENVSDHGHYVSARCVFHDDSHPSMLVYKDGWFRCLGCGHQGTLNDLYRALRGWKASYKVHTEPTSFITPYLPPDTFELENVFDRAHDRLSNSLETLGWYLRLRNVEDRVDTCRLGWIDGWYTIPVYDKEYKFMGGVVRAGAHIQESTGRRFFMPKGQQNMMYCPDWNLLTNAKSLFIVFGMFDAISLSKLRIPVVTDTSGKLAFRSDWMNFWRGKIYICPDKGEEKEGLMLASQLGWRGNLVKLQYPDGIKDPADFVQQEKSSQFVNQISKYI
jgi:hypothetical protein